MYRYILCFIVAAVTLVGCSKKPASNPVPKGESYRSLTDDGGWCWFSDPRAIYYKGQHKRTYAGWIDSHGNITVGFYDHDLNRIETRVVHPDLQEDDHDNPSLLIDRDGRLRMFYSKHATRMPIFMIRSKSPEDISEWEPEETLPLNDSITYAGASNTYTYANIMRLADEQDKLFLFWRGADFKPNFSNSHDDGKSWEKGKIFILPERIYRDRRPYLKVASNDQNAIHFAFTDGHPRDEPTNSIYYMKYQDGCLYRATGEKIMDWSALPIEPRQADVVYDATVTKEKSWIWDVAENKEGNPVIVYARFPNDSSHYYCYSIWDNSKWNNYPLINSGGWFPQTPAGETEREPNYSGGIVLDHADPSIVYLSRTVNGTFEIERWSTPDNGKNWNVEPITRDSDYDNIRPFVIRNYAGQDSLRVLWLNVKRYVHYTDYKTAIKMNLK
jgi:BNR repeat-containing family member